MMLSDIILAGNFPWLLPGLKFVAQWTKKAKSYNHLIEVASKLSHERRKEKESGKVFTYTFSCPFLFTLKVSD